MNPNINSPILETILGFEFKQIAGGILPLVAPVHATNALQNKYFVATTKNVIKEEEDGFDPRIGQSLNAPHRPIQRIREERSFDVKLHKHMQFINRLTEQEVRNNLKSSAVSEAVYELAVFYRDLMEWEAAEFYKNAANYGNTPTLDFNDTAEQILGQLESVIRSTRLSNAGNETTTTMVITSDLLAALRGKLAPLLVDSFTTYISEGIFESALNERLGLKQQKVTIFTPNSEFEANKSKGEGEYDPMWGTELLSIVGISKDIGRNPGFAHTLAESATSDNQDESNIFNVWTDYTLDPRGTKVLAECNFKVNSGARQLGHKFTISNFP